eukprot:7169908-Alexandrium_andersonii.AAC.1
MAIRFRLDMFPVPTPANSSSHCLYLAQIARRAELAWPCPPRLPSARRPSRNQPWAEELSNNVWKDQQGH